MSQDKSLETTDHQEIRQWVEAREGKPARVKGTGSKEDAGLLRIDFPGGVEEQLEEISWNEFFDKFEKEGLAFVCQDERGKGEKSYFNKLIHR